MEKNKNSDNYLSRTVEYSDDNSNELADIYAILQELKFVIESSMRLANLYDQKSNDETQKRALYSAALQSYSRCFTSSNRKHLNPNIYSDLEGEPLACHKMYLGMRNRHLAHSVNAFEQMKIGLSLAPVETGIKEIIGVGCYTMLLVYADAENMRQLARLADVARRHLETEIEKLQNEIIKVANQKNINDFYVQPNLRFTAQGDTESSRS